MTLGLDWTKVHRLTVYLIHELPRRSPRTPSEDPAGKACGNEIQFSAWAISLVALIYIPPAMGTIWDDWSKSESERGIYGWVRFCRASSNSATERFENQSTEGSLAPKDFFVLFDPSKRTVTLETISNVLFPWWKRTKRSRPENSPAKISHRPLNNKNSSGFRRIRTVCYSDRWL